MNMTSGKDQMKMKITRDIGKDERPQAELNLKPKKKQREKKVVRLEVQVRSG